MSREPDAPKDLVDNDDDAVDGNADWTPASGMIRGLIWGAIAMGVFIVGTGLLARHFPPVVMNFFLRVFLAFFMTWAITAVTQRGAGMVGTGVSIAGAAMAGLVLFSHHVIWAQFGVIMNNGEPLIGYHWVQGGTILLLSALPFAIGGGFAYMLCREGAEVSDLLDAVMSRR